jgi:hypothetical protein
MSTQSGDFLECAGVGAIMALAAVIHSPYAESIAAIYIQAYDQLGW